MLDMIEFFEMVSANDSILYGGEKLAILKARLALNAFKRAMETFKHADPDVPAADTSTFLIAA